MDGFSFCGVHCSRYGIGFIPSAAKRTQSTPEFKPITMTVAGKAGGYSFGNQVEIREFSLECFFEDITTETYEGILQWLHRDAEGKLVFDDRPYVYYNVRVGKIVEGKTYTTSHPHKYGKSILYSGTITIVFEADDPFGRMTYNSYVDHDADGATVRCGILEVKEMPPSIQPSAGNYLLYNPGTEISDTVIRIAGKAPNGCKITNQTTGDVCEFIALPSSPNYLEIDSEYGAVRLLPSSDKFAFEYHDLGYIRLAPCTPYEKDVAVSYSQGSNVVEFHLYTPREENIGQYIRINGEWLKILSIKDRGVIVNKFLNATKTEYTTIASMNEIYVEADGASLTRLEIEYVPKVR